MSQARRQRGGAARRSGRRAEVWAALVLLLRGYRILGFRLRTRQGEIDLLALKGRVLAVVEVKSRLTAQAALEAVRPDQRERLRRRLSTARWRGGQAMGIGCAEGGSAASPRASIHAATGASTRRSPCSGSTKRLTMRPWRLGMSFQRHSSVEPQWFHAAH